MLRIIICTLLAVGVCPLSSRINSFRDAQWTRFKKTYNKVYGPMEERTRRKTWESNLHLIEKHNDEYREGKHTYTLGENAYADMTNEDFVKHMNGYRMEMRKPAQKIFMSPTHLTDLPVTVDWRKKGYVTPVKDQKNCGSCWAFSATGSLEGQHFKKNGTLVSLSEQNLIDCSRPEGNMGCGGGFMDQAFEYIKKNGGIDTETSYPYTAKNGTCHFRRSQVGATDVGYSDIQTGSEIALQMAVATVGPISVAIDSGHVSFQLYKDGVYNEPLCNSIILNHAVLAAGYGVFKGQDYWLVKNSAGTTWGIKGYIMMSRNKNNQCGIATAASYPMV